jgi:hypothetical protein
MNAFLQKMQRVGKTLSAFYWNVLLLSKNNFFLNAFQAERNTFSKGKKRVRKER